MRYILIALLLIPAWVEAGTQYKNGFITKHCTEFLLGDDPAYEVCVYADADGTMTWGPTCEQRMREAMQLAAKHKFWPMFDVQMDYNIIEGSLYTPNCDEVCKAQKQLDEAKAKKKQRDDELKAKATWNQTMKDCVEVK